jgi:PilZ domain
MQWVARMSTFGRLRHTYHVVKSPLDRREESRFPESEPVQVTVLDSSNYAFDAVTLDIAETGLSFLGPISIMTGKPVRIEVNGALVLGEVRNCRLLSDEPPEYAVGVSIEHVYFGWERVYNRARGEFHKEAS